MGAPGRNGSRSGVRRVWTPAAAIAVLAVLTLPAPAHAETLVVNTSADERDGVCDAMHCSLGDACHVANQDPGATTIEIPAGDYILTVGMLGVLGPMIWNGDPGGATSITAQGSRVVTVFAPNGDLTLNRVNMGGGSALQGGLILNQDTLSITGPATYEGGGADGMTGTSQGGAIFNGANATASIFNAAIQNNSAGGMSTGFGGGIHNAGGTVGLSAVLLINDVASGTGADGGALYNAAGGTFNLGDGSNVTGNQAADAGGVAFNAGTFNVTASADANTLMWNNSAARGGAIYNDGGTLTATGPGLGIGAAGFDPNTATDDGGGLFNAAAATATLTDSTVADNTAARDGGGVANLGGLNVNGVTFRGNRATRNGGGIFGGSGGSVTLNGTTSAVHLLGNAGLDGGGIYFDGGTGGLTVNGTVNLGGAGMGEGNAARNGGGLYLASAGSTTTLGSGVSVRGNAATAAMGVGGDGGGIFVASGTPLTLSNSTFAANRAANGGGAYNLGTLNVNGGSFSDDAATSNGGGIFGGGGSVNLNGSATAVTFTGTARTGTAAGSTAMPAP